MKFPLIILSATVASLLAGAALSQSASPGSPAKHFQLPMPPELVQSILASHRSYKLSKEGDGFAKQGDWQNAQDSYQQAVDEYPTNPDALYGLAECSRIAGDITQEIEYDRKALYSARTGRPDDDGFRTIDTVKLMKFALLLSQSGNADEAQTVFNRAAAILDYTDGKPNLPLLLPPFGKGLGQVPYTPQRLQAMAHLGLSVPGIDNQFLSDEEKRAHLGEALHLQPNMAPAYFYQAQALAGRPGHSRETRDALRAAALYGDAGTKAAADKLMKDSSVEGNAQAEQALEDQHKKEAARKK